jgi:hypothetical protein
MEKVTLQLENEGLQLFAASYDDLVESLDKKKDALKVGSR